MSQRRVLLYDVETTGQSKKDEVIQFAAILFNLDKGKPEGFVNRYCMTDKEIQREAMQIHGIDRKLLIRLSESKYFEYWLENDLAYLKTIPYTFVAFNESFDHRMINQTLTLAGYEGLSMGPVLRFEEKEKFGRMRSRVCLMQLLRKITGKSGPLLSYVPEYGLTLVGIREEYKKEFPEHQDTSRPHDALFDTFVMCKIMEGMVARGQL